MAESTLINAQPQHPRAAEHPLPAGRPVNVGDSERWLSLLGGGLLALYGLRRSLAHSVLLLGAGALLYRGLTGYCALYGAMGVSTAQQEGANGTHRVSGPEEKPLIEIART
jgi:uncharacterized membrane protein